jgi:hypothetical protein
MSFATWFQPALLIGSPLPWYWWTSLTILVLLWYYKRSLRKAKKSNQTSK